MSYVRKFSIAAMAVFVFGCLLGAGSASAEPISGGQFCKSAPISHTCPTADVYPEGTEVSTTLNGVATFSTVKGTTFGQCTESNQVFKINLGKEDAFYTKEMFFSGCSEISIEPFHPTGSETTLWYPGTHNGALTPYMQMDIHMFGVVCRYYGTPYLSVFGGTSAQIVANSVPLVRMKGNELLCPTEIRLAAQWNVTTPNPLYVEQL